VARTRRRLTRATAAPFTAGYADAAGFSRAFSRRMGCSPSRYRERLVGT